ncbi:glycoside hydrolase family 2 protein [Cupriavidus cauae]|uniref:beta-mannosidase n=1 Tax=Cupriavidus cauae TaxID=2608999 RepID=A0A5M8B3D4_9BURK|nr:glycoside hydrolase family 2 protein [Cupriavidus cauae]KAA6129729.1 glycoside hydrolase family 2 protein [Cupriavidus cauae]
MPLGRPLTRQPLAGPWRMLETGADAIARPSELPGDLPTDLPTDLPADLPPDLPPDLPDAVPGNVGWLPAPVPGTVAQALQAAGRWCAEAPPALHQRDYWYRVPISGEGAHCLRLRGLATICEVWLDDTRVLDSRSMFVEHEIALMLSGAHTLTLCFRSLERALRGRRGPVRWKPRLVSLPSLRHVRTTLLGHMPGWCPSVHAVGPWREIDLLPMREPARALDAARCETIARLDGDDGIVSVQVRGVAALAQGPLTVIVDGHEAALTCRHDPLHDAQHDPQHGPQHGPRHGSQRSPQHDLVWHGSVRVPRVRKWWPHTHGEPVLYDVMLRAGAQTLPCARVGFRHVDVDERDGGFVVRVNGVPVFCRGACVASLDLHGHAPDARTCAAWLEQARDANMNMIRISGVTCYQGEAFYAACNAMGLLVWQDFLFANFDYSANVGPSGGINAAANAVTNAVTNAGTDAATNSGTSAQAGSAAELLDDARREVHQWLAAHGHHPSLAVLCGGSEAEQQAAMLGAPREAWRQPLFDTVIPDCIAAHGVAVPYVRNSPSGGAWPFQPDRGVSHYYGVGAYQRPLDDARRARVRFAAECLAFANVPCERTLREAMAGVAPVHDPRWKRAVPRDAGASWDFEDVRDFYLQSLYAVDPARLRREDPARYLQCSRAVVAELMSEVFAEWRRAGSSCAGGLVWQWQDLAPGAGWGIVDALRRPKSAWHALRQVWQPRQVLLTDEGLNGVHVHLINETGAPQPIRLQLRCLRDGLTPLLDVARDFTLAPRSVQCVSGAELAGEFFDFAHAYRFGPRLHDVVHAAWFDASGSLVSEAFYLPDRSANALTPPELHAQVERIDGQWWLTISARRFARWVQIDDANLQPASDYFHLAPGASRRVLLRADEGPRDREGHGNEGGGEGLNRLANTAIPMGEIRALNAPRPLGYGA